MKFNIFRNPFIHQYIKAWQDGFDQGYQQANSENHEDINYWIGYHDGLMENEGKE